MTTKTPTPTPITAADVRDLVQSRKADPMMIRFLDADGGIDIVSQANPVYEPVRDFGGDDTYTTFDGVPYAVIVTQVDLLSSGDTDWENATDADLAAAAEWLNNA